MKHVALLRREKGWSQSELARQSGLNQVTVNQIENGRLIPYPKQLARLADALGVGADGADRLLEEVTPGA